MTILQTIEKAIEGGYTQEMMQNSKKIWAHHLLTNSGLLAGDRSFWQSLGKAMKWETQAICWECKKSRKGIHDTSCCNMAGAADYDFIDGWLYYWHRFIDHLAEGKNIDDYFQKLK